jgi:TonB family protein
VQPAGRSQPESSPVFCTIEHSENSLFMLCSRIFRSGPSSLKRFLGATFLVVLLSSAISGLAQDTTRKIVKKVTVQYPSLLKNRGIGGTVRLKVFIKPDGSVRDTEVLGGNPILAESAQKSVVQWKFSPAGLETNIEVSILFDPNAEN